MTNTNVFPTLSLVCPSCRGKFATQLMCTTCGKQFSRGEGWIDLCDTADKTNEVTQKAYSLYALLYAPIAVLVYHLVWRGNIFRHIQFFRQAAKTSDSIVDIAIGDGSLTTLALFKQPKHPHSLIGIDISESMLRKAQKRMSHLPVTLIKGDVMRLPFEDASIPLVTCFGGFNSFPSGETAFKEVRRILSAQGKMRGSVLLMPRSKWRSALVHHWIRKGYQSEVVTQETFSHWVEAAGLKFTTYERLGDVVLFEVTAK